MSLRVLCRLLVVAAFGLALSGCNLGYTKYNGWMEVLVVTQPTGGVGRDSLTCTFSTVMHQKEWNPPGTRDDIVLEGMWVYEGGDFRGQTAWYLSTSDYGITRTVTLTGYNGVPLTGRIHFEWTWTDDKGDHRTATETVTCTAP